MSDPQFGMYAKDQNFAQETANFEFAIANINRLHPRFVVICGDLVNHRGDLRQIAEYRRILKNIDPTIPIYSVAGNHDVGDVPTMETLQAFRQNIGPDYYTFASDNILGIVLDSNLIRAPQGAPQQAQEQKQWLIQTLQVSRSDKHKQIVVFQHIPYFINNANESDDYFNIPQVHRRIYLDLLKRAGVKYVFAGHYHRNAGGVDGQLTEIVTGAVGKPLGGSVSGFRIVAVEGDTLNTAWYCFGGVPNQLVPGELFNTPCHQ